MRGKRVMGVSRRSFLRAGSLAGAGLALGSLVPSRGWAQPSFKVGFLPRAFSPLILRYGEASEKFKVKLEYVPMPDTTMAMQVLGQGDLQGANVTNQHVIRAVGEKLNVVAVCGLAGGWIEFDIRADIPLAYGDFSGLKEYVAKRKREGNPFKLAVPTSSYQHLQALWQLKKHGIDHRDVEFLNLVFPEHPKVLELKQVDMVSTVAAFGAAAVVKGYGKVFYYPYDSPSGKNSVMLAVNSTDAKRRPEAVQAAVNAHMDLVRSVMEDPDKGLKYYAKDTGLPEAILRHYLKNVQYDYRIDVEDMQGSAKMLFEVGWVPQDLSEQVERAVDFSFLEKATGQSRKELSTWKLKLVL